MRIVTPSRAAFAFVVAVVLPACQQSGAPAQPRDSDGELHLSTRPDDTIVVHTDGSFELEFPEHTSLRGCGGVCRGHVDKFTVRGDTIVQGSNVVMTRAADGTIDMPSLDPLAIDSDGALIGSGQRWVLDASGRLVHVVTKPTADRTGRDELLDALTITGATTPELRRRAMLVLVFLLEMYTMSALDEVTH